MIIVYNLKDNKNRCYLDGEICKLHGGCKLESKEDVYKYVSETCPYATLKDNKNDFVNSFELSCKFFYVPSSGFTLTCNFCGEILDSSQLNDNMVCSKCGNTKLPKMTPRLLKDGDWVSFRNGLSGQFFKDVVLLADGAIIVISKYKTFTEPSGNKDWDVIMVRRPSSFKEFKEEPVPSISSLIYESE